MVARRAAWALTVLTAAFASACHLDHRSLSVVDSGGDSPTVAAGDTSSDGPRDADESDLSPPDGSSSDVRDAGDGSDGAIQINGSCASPVSALAAGDGTCALLPGGRVACWGVTASGASAVPVLVPGVTGASSLTVGTGQVCAVLSDHSVSCWDVATPTPARVPGLAGVTAVAATGGVVCALESDGSVWCWGSPSALFPTLTTVPTRFASLPRAKAFDLSDDHVCALLSDGAIWCWTSIDLPKPDLPPPCEAGLTCDSPLTKVTGLADVTTLGAGGQFTCALAATGKVWCWGDNSLGELGNGTSSGFSATPTQVPGLTDATAISVRGTRTCAVHATGAISCWGDNFVGSLGIGSTTGPEDCGGSPCSRVPVTVVRLTGATSVALGWGHACALLSAGAVSCWGANGNGELGTGSMTGPETTCDNTQNSEITYNICSTTPVSVTCAGAPGPPSNVAASGLAVVSTVTTLAGQGTAEFADGPGAAAIFDAPSGVAADATGNVYVADAANHRLRKVTPAGVTTTLAGSGTAAFADGAGAAASFDAPAGVAVDGNGNVYVADANNNRIRRVTPAGVVTTLAGSGTAAFSDGTGTAASFDAPAGVAVDAAGNVTVADTNNNRIRKVTPAGVVTTLAGSGLATFADKTGAAAGFDHPSGVAVDAAGNVIVGDSHNHRLRRVSPAGVVTTLAGAGAAGFADGIRAAAKLDTPVGVAVDAAGNIYVGDSHNHRIRRVSPAGAVTTLAGTGTAAFADGAGTAQASFDTPLGVAVDADGDVTVGDSANNRIRKIASVGIGQLAVTWSRPSSEGASPITGYTVSARAANEPTQTCTTTGATSCTVSGLASGVAYDVSVTASNATGIGAPSASVAATPNDDAGMPATGAGAPSPPLEVAASAVSVTTVAGSDGAFPDGTGVAATFNGPWGLALDAAGNFYVADTGNHRIRKVTPAGVLTTLAGSSKAGSTDATGAEATFSRPEGIAVDSGGTVYVADSTYNRIRKVTPAGVVTTLAGSGTPWFAEGTGAAASFNGVVGLAVDAGGNVYVADSNNNRLRKVTPAGVVTTLAGSGTAAFADGTGAAASFNGLAGVAVDANGNVYVGENGTGNSRVRKVTPAGVVTTLAGSGKNDIIDGKGAAASFNNPVGVAVDAAGNVSVADAGLLRRITPAGVVTTLAGSGEKSVASLGVAVDAAGNAYTAWTGILEIALVGPGKLAVTWSPPSTQGFSPLTGYTASARAPGQSTQTCSSTGATACTVGGLTAGVAYGVSVTATNAQGTSVPSSSATATVY